MKWTFPYPLRPPCTDPTITATGKPITHNIIAGTANVSVIIISDLSQRMTSPAAKNAAAIFQETRTAIPSH